MAEPPTDVTRPDPLDHAHHDPTRIAALAADDLSGAERTETEAWLAACPDCRTLADDLRSIAAATRSLPAPARPRDFRLSAGQAAHARGWRARIAGLWPGAGFRRPLGATLATLGIAGLLFVTLSSAAPMGILSTVGSAVDDSAAGGGSGSEAYAAPSAAASGAPSSGPSAVPAASAAAAPSEAAAPSPASSSVPAPSNPLGPAASPAPVPSGDRSTTGGPAYGPESPPPAPGDLNVASPVASPGGAPVPGQDTTGSKTESSTPPTPVGQPSETPTAAAATSATVPWLALVSALILAVGIGLLVGPRLLRRR